MDPYYQCEVGRRLVSGLNSHARVATGGFASVRDVETKEKEDLQHSFFLSETLKYLYLLFNSSFLDSGSFVFTTEGHPLPVIDEFRGRRTGRQLPHRLRGNMCWRPRNSAPLRPLGKGCSALDLRVCAAWQGSGAGALETVSRFIDSACHVPDHTHNGNCRTHDDCGVDAATCRERLCSQSNWCFTP